LTPMVDMSYCPMTIRLTMHLRLNRKGHLPIHVQLKAQLAHLIQSGEWSPGRQLPTVRRLAVLLHINRNTAARVFAELEREGYLTCERGRGTFVCPRRAGARGGRTRELLWVLDEALGQARRLGFGPVAFAAALYARAHASAGALRVRKVPVLFVECNPPRLQRFSRQLVRALPLRVEALLVKDLERRVRRDPGSLEKYRLVVTTLSHLRETRRLLGGTGRDVVGLPAEKLHPVPACGVSARSLRGLLNRARVDEGRLDRAGIDRLRRRLAVHARR